MDEPRALAMHPLARYGPSVGMAGGIIFLALWFTAALVSGDWVLGRNTLSELGGKDGLAALLFNGGCVFAGVCLYIFGLAIWMRVPGTNYSAPFIRLGAIGLVLVGIFNINTGLAHSLATLLFFLTIAIGIALLAPTMLKRDGLRVSGWVAVTGLAISVASLAVAPLPLSEAIAVICIIAWGIVMGGELLSGKPSKA